MTTPPLHFLHPQPHQPALFLPHRVKAGMASRLVFPRMPDSDSANSESPREPRSPAWPTTPRWQRFGPAPLPAKDFPAEERHQHGNKNQPCKKVAHGVDQQLQGFARRFGERIPLHRFSLPSTGHGSGSPKTLPRRKPKEEGARPSGKSRRGSSGIPSNPTS